MWPQKTVLIMLFLYLDVSYAQKDCTGVDCPVLNNCIKTMLENGACCPTCSQRGCTCEGYQYYDCAQAGFRRGKVPEGESYFVDFGSTECSCPRGGGNISCHFIPCPEIPPNCVDVLQPQDGCPQCGSIGCVHGNKKYDAGHSFQMESCQVCHCPNEGGSLMCSIIPGCVKENNGPLRDVSQTNRAESASNFGNTLPLYKPDPPNSGTADSDYILARPTSSTQNLEQPLESTTLTPPHQESASNSHDERRREPEQTHGRPNPEQSGQAKVSHNTNPTVTEAQKESLQTGESSEGKTTASHRPQQASADRTIRHNSERNNSTRAHKASRNAARHQKHSQHGHQSVKNQEQEERPHPVIQFSPTSRPPVRMRDFGEQPRRLAQTLLNYQDAEVSSEELLRSCCETGEKWASVKGHCSSMEPPTQDRHSICWTSQQQCCLGSLREQQCLSGLKAATAGASCEKDSGDICGINSFKECCGCCSLGLHFRAEGLNCEAHPSLGFHCRHIFMTCCEEEEEEEGAGGRNAWHPVRERPALDPTAPPKRVSDSPLFPNEAFSLGRDGENAVESPVEVQDMDECLIYEGRICHHKCVNTPGSFRCECFPGFTLQYDAVTCAIETVEDQNRLKENERAGPTLPPPPPTEPSAPSPCEENNPCEQQCTPVGGRTQCSCFPGFALATNEFSCEDINECVLTRVCQLNERCVNTAGSYICQTLITCPTGYHIHNDMCEDVNECAEGSHSCGPDFDCVNTMGSFRCNPKPRCATGFSKDPQGNCADVDECSLSPPCGLGFNCINTVGSYLCNRKIICSRGYHSSPDGSRCIDVDECQSGLSRCGEGQLCHNMAGSYRCECQTGYQYDTFRRMCVDINECWRYPGRLCAQTCENTPGSYYCSCTVGFRLSSDAKNCEDVNECLSNPCGQECSNLYGSYQCYCNQGFFLRDDGHSCDDIDECSQSSGHLCTYKCVNVPGSYQCACPEYGYTMAPNGRSCRDIDECTTGSHNCSLSETCYNIQGGHRCLSFDCPPNYRRVSDTRCERMSCPNPLDCQTSPLRITYYYLSFQSNIVTPAQIFRIGPSPAYSGDNVIVSITQGNDENYFSTRKLNTYTGAVYLHRQVEGPRDFLITVVMKLWRQGTFTTFQARMYVFITGTLL
ncbi:fibulin-2-like [Eucyclogobius newberryi]|uniref:fibulin-2-like n=1 Tax=Eucyclogobius newberryi TaxID=166745 RepID=UPI003B5CDCF7